MKLDWKTQEQLETSGIMGVRRKLVLGYEVEEGWDWLCEDIGTWLGTETGAMERLGLVRQGHWEPGMEMV